MIDEHKPGTDSSVSCEIYNTTSLGSGLINTSNATLLGSAAYEMMIGQTYVLAIRRDNTAYKCTATRGVATVTTMGTTTLANSPIDVGLRVVGSTGRYHWLMAVSSP